MLSGPTTPTNNDHKIVRFTNVSDFDFLPEMGAMYGGVPYFVPAGKSMLMPLTIGEHLATHLSRQIIIKKAPVRDEKEIDGKGTDRKLWDPGTIDQLKTLIISEVYEEDRPAPTSPEEALKRKVEDLNKTFPADATPVVPAPVTPPPVAPISEPVAPPIPPANAVIDEPKVEEAGAYKDKAEVMAELKKRGIQFDARASKANLLKLLE